MPLYEYKCNNCESTFEAFQNIKDRATAVCPKCGNLANMFIVPVKTLKTETYLMSKHWARKHEQQAKRELEHFDPTT